METKIVEKMKLGKTKYTFKIQKHHAGLIKINGSSFETPDSDGTQIKSLMNRIPNGQIAVITLIVEE